MLKFWNFLPKNFLLLRIYIYMSIHNWIYNFKKAILHTKLLHIKFFCISQFVFRIARIPIRAYEWKKKEEPFIIGLHKEKWIKNFLRFLKMNFFCLFSRSFPIFYNKNCSLLPQIKGINTRCIKVYLDWFVLKIIGII